MRAKAKLTDVTAEFSIYGLTGNTINFNSYSGNKYAGYSHI